MKGKMKGKKEGEGVKKEDDSLIRRGKGLEEGWIDEVEWKEEEKGREELGKWKIEYGEEEKEEEKRLERNTMK